MRSADNIKKRIKNTTIKTNPQVNKAVLNDLLDRMDRAEGVSINAEQPNIWIKIMKSKITKYAAATIIMIAGLLSLTFIDKIPFCEKLLHDRVNSEFQIGMK